jgi:hypothetical protein
VASNKMMKQMRVMRAIFDNHEEEHEEEHEEDDETGGESREFERSAEHGVMICFEHNPAFAVKSAKRFTS